MRIWKIVLGTAVVLGVVSAAGFHLLNLGGTGPGGTAGQRRPIPRRLPCRCRS